MRLHRTGSLVKTVIFTILVPGTVAVVVPRVARVSRSDPGGYSFARVLSKDSPALDTAARVPVAGARTVRENKTVSTDLKEGSSAGFDAILKPVERPVLATADTNAQTGSRRPS